MATKVTFIDNGIANKINKICTDSGLGTLLATAAKQGMSPYVPFRNGYLDASATVEPFAVSYSTAYARYVYYGTSLNFSRERHALACAEWDKAYSQAHKAELASAATYYIRGM